MTLDDLARHTAATREALDRARAHLERCEEMLAVRREQPRPQYSDANDDVTRRAA